jgi:hypothetical protein
MTVLPAFRIGVTLTSSHWIGTCAALTNSNSSD